MSSIEKFLYYHRVGIALRGVLTTVLFLFAVAILIRILMPQNILTLRLVAAIILLLIGLYLLCGEFGYFDENLSLFHKKKLTIRLWNEVYNVFFTKAEFRLKFLGREAPAQMRINSVFAQSSFIFESEAKLNIHTHTFLGSIKKMPFTDSESKAEIVPAVEKSGKKKSLAAPAKKSKIQKIEETKNIEIHIYSFFARVKVFL